MSVPPLTATSLTADAQPVAALPPARPVAAIVSYHAHVYFDGAAERATAGWLRERMAERFAVQLGRWHDRPVGPHGRPMYQIAFAVELFPRLLPWLMLNRNGLSVLVHPNTGNQHDDHLVHALWLGPALALDGSRLPHGRGEGSGAIDPVVPNTVPAMEA